MFTLYLQRKFGSYSAAHTEETQRLPTHTHIHSDTVPVLSPLSLPPMPPAVPGLAPGNDGEVITVSRQETDQMTV
ncbi:hypothetical protein EON64_06585 [archaeon]|nr:MAG: hypothetical protein EON64_06585 [archaeon]